MWWDRYYQTVNKKKNYFIIYFIFYFYILGVHVNVTETSFSINGITKKRKSEENFFTLCISIQPTIKNSSKDFPILDFATTNDFVNFVPLCKIFFFLFFFFFLFILFFLFLFLFFFNFQFLVTNVTFIDDKYCSQISTRVGSNIFFPVLLSKDWE